MKNIHPGLKVFSSHKANPPDAFPRLARS
ncbi:hypothetical protein E2C01_066675 [Portunus trituberculatus]|uniref:Uncharacterized protein n=1 Tax=Portunus trituberculatus TaxID=210409 RepID=A0A5B7HHS0_PORTR|nr:hypothetical protein [Portunus trituberculatus]